jgi:hypothetical protein
MRLARTLRSRFFKVAIWGVFVTGVGMSGKRTVAGPPSFPGVGGVPLHRVYARRHGLCAWSC